MKIKFHGAGKEVGRSCIELTMDNKKFLLDAGLKITPAQSEFPTTINNLSKFKAVFLSHIHLDHTGAVPLIYSKGLRCPIYASHLTKNLLSILLKDSWKISRIMSQEVGYSEKDVVEAINLVHSLPVNKHNTSNLDVDGIEVTCIDAGHIPGSRCFHFQSYTESIIYTGDINLNETIINNPLDLNSLSYADTLIIESTYGGREHEDRTLVEKEFLEKISETLNQGGVALIPTFAIGRAQELLIMVSEKFPGVPLYLDGMAKKISEVYLKDYEFKNRDRLETAYNRTTIVNDSNLRDSATNKSCIVITTSGMLDGGPVLSYIPKISNDKNSAILLTGYQAEETNGRCLLDNGYVTIDGINYDIKCFFKKYDFSGHADCNQLHSVVKKVSPKTLILNHGDIESLKAFSEYAKINFNCDVIIAENDEEIEL